MYRQFWKDCPVESSRDRRATERGKLVDVESRNIFYIINPRVI